MLKRTPLHAAHQKLGAKLVEFGGWEMPVQYTSIVDEHQTVRAAAGLFDIAHMGEFQVSGPGATSFLNRLLTNDASRLKPGQGQYTLMCNQRGGVVDDLYLYQLAENSYLLIVNASRIDDDFAWAQAELARLAPEGGVTLVNISGQVGAIAIQGPAVAKFIDACLPGESTGGIAVKNASELKKNEIARFRWKDTTLWAARTGYTGEDGFEIVADADQLEPLWNSILELGQPHGIKPAGLGARDTLRTEVCYPLYGHELDLETTPIEAGVGFFVALEKGDFNGREVLAAQKKNGTTKKCAAFKMTGKSPPPRPHYAILAADGARLGEVGSGTQSPSLGIGIGLGYVPPSHSKAGTALLIEIRNNTYPAEVVSRPIYKKAV